MGPRPPLGYRIANGFLSGVFRLLTRRHVHGAENVPAAGPLLVASNHIHAVDPPLINVSIPHRQVLFLAKRELVEDTRWWQRWCYLHYGLIPLDRTRLDRRAMGRALEHLEAGGTVGLFPEGVRSPTGELQRPPVGSAYLALAAEGAPILPVAIHGIAGLRITPRTLMRRPMVSVRIGEPFVLAPGGPATDRQTLREAGELIMGRIAELLPAEARGAYSVGSADGGARRIGPHPDKEAG